MSVLNIYDDLHNSDLGEKLLELKQQNDKLHTHIESLDKDVQKLCTELLQMKKVEQSLKRNISELYNTAKNEIERKDKMIAELRSELDNLLFRRRNAYTANNSNLRLDSPKTNSPNYSKRNRVDIKKELEPNTTKRIKHEPENEIYNDSLVKLEDPNKERVSRSRSNSTHRHDQHKAADTKDRRHRRTRSHSRERESSRNHSDHHHSSIKRESFKEKGGHLNKENKHSRSRSKDGSNTQSRSNSRDKERHGNNNRNSYSKSSRVSDQRDHGGRKRSRELDERSPRHSHRHHHSRSDDNQDNKKANRSDYKDNSSSSKRRDSYKKIEDEKELIKTINNLKSELKNLETNGIEDVPLKINEESDLQTNCNMETVSKPLQIPVSIPEGVPDINSTVEVTNTVKIEPDTSFKAIELKTETSTNNLPDKILVECNTSIETQDGNKDVLYNSTTTNNICDSGIKTEPDIKGEILGPNQSDIIKLNTIRRRRCVIKIVN